MKIGILGDVHGNADALRAVLFELNKNKVDQVLTTGDLIGYYFSPREVVDLLKNQTAIFVKGNHEKMLERSRYNKGEMALIESKYGCGIKLALETFSEEQLNWIINLPTSISLDIGGCKIFLCHGTPFSEEAYLYPDAPPEALAKYSSLPHDFIIMGHTHYPMDRKAGSVRVINPGSVGQPRSKTKKASWATLDTKTGKVEFYSTAYDATSLIKQCKERHPEIPYLADVLWKR